VTEVEGLVFGIQFACRSVKVYLRVEPYHGFFNFDRGGAPVVVPGRYDCLLNPRFGVPLYLVQAGLPRLDWRRKQPVSVVEQIALLLLPNQIDVREALNLELQWWQRTEVSFGPNHRVLVAKKDFAVSFVVHVLVFTEAFLL
jgi:hypothetical protein